VAPWRRITTIEWLPNARASDAPSSDFTTSRLVSPNSSRLSQNGAYRPIAAPRWNTGTSGTPEIANGMIGGAWWWHTALTSGRALKISPWITRSE